MGRIEKEFIPYEIALALKQLGFDEPCFGRYIYDGRGKEWFLVQTQQTKSTSVIFEGARSVDGISVAAPLYQQAFRWFREKYELYGTIRYGNNEFDKSIYLFPCINGVIVGNDSFKTQEKAELECLKKLIEIVNEKI